VNVVGSELAEHASLEQAAREMESMVPRRDYVISVMDASGIPTHEVPGGLPIGAITRSNAAGVFAETVTATTGEQWRGLRPSDSRHAL